MSETIATRIALAGMGRSRWRLPVALAAAVVAAEAAVLLLRPRDDVIDPARVSARSYFSAAELDRARGFRRPQLALYGAQIAIEGAVLLLLVRRPPRRLRRLALGRWGRRPLLAGAATGAALSLAIGLAPLPVAAIARQRAVNVGLVTQSWAGWAGDVAKSSAIAAAFAAGGAALVLALMRRFPRTWWAPGSVAVVVVGVALVYVGPVLLDPVFNRFTALPAGRTRSDVLALAGRAGVDVGEVYEVDASRRTTAANAYVNGLGATKRVVLYDTLLRRFSRDEVRLVVAHELGHVRHRDLLRGLLWLALVAPFGLLAVQRLTEALTPQAGGDLDGLGLRRRAAEPAGPAVLPALALSLALVATLLGTLSNQLSRRVEARADAYALRLTGTPAPFIGFERRIALQNVADPEPPAWVRWLLGTHPSTVERIGAAVAYQRAQRTLGAGPGGPAGSSPGGASPPRRTRGGS
jgi:STE24 endopeptidase